MFKVLQLGKPVDVLINNAGIMFGPRKETSEVSISSLSLSEEKEHLIAVICIFLKKIKHFGRGLSTSFAPTTLATSSSPTSYYLSSSNLERVASLQDW